MENNFHRLAMTMALQLAKKGRRTTSPNPMVGCVLVRDKQIVGQGFHRHAGGPHAEIEALNQAGDLARGATAYVTLEPCCHHGRTPPCTDALIRAQIKKIYVACIDPNPLIAGKGVHALRDAGIEVEVGLCEKEARRLNRFFIHFMTHKRPFVIAKWAMSLDGKMETHPSDSRDISGEASLKSAHRTRAIVDAIVIGRKTALADNPSLTVQHLKTKRHPLRFILASSGPLPLELTLFSAKLPGQTIVVTTAQSDPTWRQALLSRNIEVWVCKARDNQVDLHDFLDKLAECKILSLLVEGGPTLRDRFFQMGRVDAVEVYVAPKIIGTFSQKRTLPSLALKRLGNDFLLTGDC